MRLLLFLVASAAVVEAASTTLWEMTSYVDFLRGRFDGVSLNRDGRLLLAPKADTLFSSEQPAIWSVAQAPDGTLYAGTGHRGKLYRLRPSGKGELLWTADQPEIFALAVDSKGTLYAATSPDGKIYRFENDKAVEYFSPGAKYIWSLAFGRDGALYAGTGDEGKIFRITAANQGEVYYETGQAQVTCLAFDREGRLLAGSEPNGVIYRISEKGRAFVLYDSTLPEIRSIVPAPDGGLYVAALGGSLAKRTNPQAGQPGVVVGGVPGAVATATMVVSDASAQGGLDVKPKPEQPKVQPAPVVAAPVYAAATDYTGVEKSALYRIHTDHTVETIWSSKEENVYDLISGAQGIVFSTDSQGRIYRLTPDRKVTLLLQTNEGETTQLVESRTGLIAATAEMGKLFRVGQEIAPSGIYTSPVHDAGSVARWGRVNWRGDFAGAQLTIKTRSGNSGRPDSTWSDWSAPLRDPSGSLVTSPNARYIQWMAEFQPGKGASPAIDSVALAYLPQNTPPSVKSVTVSSQPGAPSQAKPPASPPTAVYSITVTDSGETTPSLSSGTPSQSVARANPQQMQVSWQAEDPDNDRLAYSLYFRGDDEREWKALRLNIAETSFTIDSDALADGRYLFRVVATDSPANAAETAREAELMSPPVIIDNTPPVLTATAPVRNGSAVEITVEASDASSALRRCEYSRNARPWQPVEASDGVTDSMRERFVIRLDNLPAGEHLVAVRVYDAAGNAGLTKVVLR